jgi:hypothetical protein
VSRATDIEVFEAGVRHGHGEPSVWRERKKKPREIGVGRHSRNGPISKIAPTWTRTKNLLIKRRFLDFCLKDFLLDT